MIVERIHVGDSSNFLMWRIRDSGINEEIYVIMTEGELIFLKPIPEGFLTQFFGIEDELKKAIE